MNKDILEGKWEQLKGEIQKQWGNLTDDSLNVIEGSRTKLVGALQEKYGIMKDEAEKQVAEWDAKRCNTCDNHSKNPNNKAA